MIFETIISHLFASIAERVRIILQSCKTQIRIPFRYLSGFRKGFYSILALSWTGKSGA